MFPLRLGSFPQCRRPPLLPSRRRLWSPSLARRRCSGVAASLLGSMQRRRPLPPLSLSALSLEKRKGKTPMGVGGLGVRVSALPLAFEPWCHDRRGESPMLPRLRPSGRPRWHRSPLRRPRCRGARRGAKGVSPVRGWIRLACARAPVPRRVGRSDGKGIPSRAHAAAAWLAWCGADPRRGEQG
jgi:hypothetical protein